MPERQKNSRETLTWAPTDPSARTVAPDRFGLVIPERLVFVRHLGRGGMGRAFEAHDRTLDRRVAVKVLRRDRAANEMHRARLLREARALSSLDHENVCRIYDYVAGEDADFLVLEFIEGETLRSLLARGPLSRAQGFSIARQIIAALRAAHGKGIVHRDLKPDNVMLTGDSKIKVLDFGLARMSEAGLDAPVWGRSSTDPYPGAQPGESLLASPDGVPTPTGATPAATGSARLASSETVAGSLLGTPAYMSPEQATGQAVGPESDIFSFGLVLSQLFGGPRPHPRGLESDALLERAREGKVEPPRGVPRPLARLIERQLSIDPSERPVAAEVEASLAAIASRPRRLALVAAAAVLAVVIAAGAVKYTVDLRRERNEAVQARLEQEEIVSFLAGLFSSAAPDEARGADLTARQLLDRGVDRMQDDLTDRPLVHARLSDVIGDVYVELGDYDSAEPLFEQSLAIRREVLGEEHPVTLKTMTGTSILYELQGDLDRAERLARAAFESQKRLLGENHDNTLGSLAQLAIILEAKADLAGALLLTEDLYRRRMEVSGPEDDATTSVGNNLATIYARLGRYDEARELFESLLEMRRRTLGDDHPLTLSSIGNLGILHKMTGHPELALPYLEEQYRVSARVHGEGDPQIAMTTANYANTLKSLGQVERAHDILLRAHEAVYARLDPGHRVAVFVTGNLASTELELGNIERAESLYRGMLAATRESLSPDDSLLFTALKGLSSVLREKGEYRDSANLLEKVIVGRTTIFGAEHASVFGAMHDLAVAEWLDGERTRAIEILEQAVAGFERTLGEDARETRLAREDLEEMKGEVG